MGSIRKFIDIGANLTDSMYQGFYNGTRKHEADLANVLDRSRTCGVDKIIITGVNLEKSKEALNIAAADESLFTTVGCHPTHCNEIETSGDPYTYLNCLRDIATQNQEKVVAIGECGLDYDRLHFCEKNIQQKYFDSQLELCKETNLPLFLHCRNAADDFIEMIKNHNYPFRGVVHSFDGSLPVMKCLIELGFYIGINGCSLKTEENLEVVKSIPTNKLLLETDCPWCEIRPSHAGFKYVKTRYPTSKKEKWKPDLQVKSRNEPSNIVQVLEILAAVREENEYDLCIQVFKNTEQLFFS